MLAPCTSCRRFIRSSETACPFCARRRGLSTATAVLAAAAISACQSSGPTQPTADAIEPPAPATATADQANADGTADAAPADSVAELPVEPSATAAPTVADNTPPPKPTAVTPEKPQRPPRPMVARYGLAPRLPPPGKPTP